MYKTKNCFIRDVTDEVAITTIEIEHSCDDPCNDPKYPFGSRAYFQTRIKLNEILNGEYYKLPFGFRLIKTK